MTQTGGHRNSRR